MQDATAKIIGALQQLCEIDGHTSVEEQALLKKILPESPHQDPPDLDDLAASLEDPQERQDLIRLMLMVSLADGSTTAHEYDYIRDVAMHLGLSEELLEDLRQHTMLALDL